MFSKVVKRLKDSAGIKFINLGLRLLPTSERTLAQVLELSKKKQIHVGYSGEIVLSGAKYSELLEFKAKFESKEREVSKLSAYNKHYLELFEPTLPLRLTRNLSYAFASNNIKIESLEHFISLMTSDIVIIYKTGLKIQGEFIPDVGKHSIKLLRGFFSSHNVKLTIRG